MNLPQTTEQFMLNKYMIILFFSLYFRFVSNLYTCTGDAVNVRVGSLHLRGLLGRNAIDGAHQPVVSSAPYPGAGRGPHLPWPYFLLKALWKARRTLPWLRAHVFRLSRVLTHR